MYNIIECDAQQNVSFRIIINSHARDEQKVVCIFYFNLFSVSFESIRRIFLFLNASPGVIRSGIVGIRLENRQGRPASMKFL